MGSSKVAHHAFHHAHHTPRARKRATLHTCHLSRRIKHRGTACVTTASAQEAYITITTTCTHLELSQKLREHASRPSCIITGFIEHCIHASLWLSLTDTCTCTWPHTGCGIMHRSVHTMTCRSACMTRGQTYRSVAIAPGNLLPYGTLDINVCHEIATTTKASSKTLEGISLSLRLHMDMRTIS